MVTYLLRPSSPNLSSGSIYQVGRLHFWGRLLTTWVNRPAHCPYIEFRWTNWLSVCFCFWWSWIWICFPGIYPSATLFGYSGCQVTFHCCRYRILHQGIVTSSFMRVQVSEFMAVIGENFSCCSFWAIYNLESRTGCFLSWSVHNRSDCFASTLSNWILKLVS